MQSRTLRTGSTPQVRLLGCFSVCARGCQLVARVLAPEMYHLSSVVHGLLRPGVSFQQQQQQQVWTWYMLTQSTCSVSL